MQSRALALGNLGVSRHLKNLDLLTSADPDRAFPELRLVRLAGRRGRAASSSDHTRKKAVTAASLGWAGRARKLLASGPAPRPSFVFFPPASSPPLSLLPLFPPLSFLLPTPPTYRCSSSHAVALPGFPCLLAPRTFVPFVFEIGSLRSPPC